jgi:hypothetical protein
MPGQPSTPLEASTKGPCAQPTLRLKCAISLVLSDLPTFWRGKTYINWAAGGKAQTSGLDPLFCEHLMAMNLQRGFPEFWAA